MKLNELINEDLIKLELEASNKKDAIRELIDILQQAGKVSNRKKFEKAVFNREKEGTTGIGYGVAIPHGKSKGVKETSLVFGRKKDGIDFESLDGDTAKIFFMIAVPEKSDSTHLNVLSRLSRALMHEELRKNLLDAKSKQKVLDLIKKYQE